MPNSKTHTGEPSKKLSSPMRYSYSVDGTPMSGDITYQSKEEFEKTKKSVNKDDKKSDLHGVIKEKYPKP